MIDWSSIGELRKGNGKEAGRGRTLVDMNRAPGAMSKLFPTMVAM